MIDVDAEPEPLDGYLPPPYVPPATLDERLVKAWREVTRTPGRAALATVGLCAMAGFFLSLRTIPITTADARGPLRANCGISFYLGGASNRAVDASCGYVFGSRIPQLIILGLVVVVATALLLRAIAQGEPAEATPWPALAATPGRAALAVLDLALLVTAVAALQPVTLATADPAGPLNAHCGLQYFVFGASNSAVGHACRNSYGPRAAVFFVALAGLVVGVVALARMVRRPVEPAA
jgi:hypothetical protein